MRLIQSVKFPVSVLVADSTTGGNPFEMLDVLTGGVVENVGPIAMTQTGKLSCGVRVGDPTTGRVVFLQGFCDLAKQLHSLHRGEVVHVKGERRMFNGTTNFRVYELLPDAPIVENGRFISTKQEVPVDPETLPAAVSDEYVND